MNSGTTLQTAMPNTLFVVKGLESLTSPSEVALLDAFHDLMEDGEVTMAGGATMSAPGAGVLITIDTGALQQSVAFTKLSTADKANAASLADPAQLLQAVLAAHGSSANGGAVFTPSSFTGRVRSFIPLVTLSDAQRVQLAQTRAAGSNELCSHAGLVAATASNQAPDDAETAAPTVGGLDAVFRRVAGVWMDPHVQNVLIPRAFAAFVVVFLAVFAFVPGTMPPKGAYHHPLSVYQNMGVVIGEEDAKPCDVDVTGEGRWEGPNPADLNPKRKNADAVAAQEAAPPGIQSGSSTVGSKADVATGGGSARRRRRSGSSGSPRRGK